VHRGPRVRRRPNAAVSASRESPRINIYARAETRESRAS